MILAPRQLPMRSLSFGEEGLAPDGETSHRYTSPPLRAHTRYGVAELEAESLLFSKKVNRAPHLGFEPWTTTAGAMGQSHYAAAALPKEDVQFELLIPHIQCPKSK